MAVPHTSFGPHERDAVAVVEGIARIFHEALTCATEEDLGRACLAVAEEVTGSRFGFIAEINPATGRLDDIAISDPGWDACRMGDRAGHGTRLPVALEIHGIYGRVLRDRRGSYTNDPASHPDRIGAPPGHPQLRAFLGVPLVHGGRTWGMFAVGNREGGYGPLQLAAAEGLAPAITQAFVSTRAERAVRESEAQLRATFERTTDAIVISDPRGAGRVVAVNPAACRLFGYAEEEFRGMDRAALLDPDDAGLAPMLADRAARGHAGAELTYVRKDGSRFHGDITSASFTDRTGEPRAITVIRDVTDRRRTEAALVDALARLEIARAAASLGIFDHDLVTDALRWDDRMRDLWGLAPAERVTNDAYRAGIPPEDLARVDLALARATDPAGDGAFSAEHRVRSRADGSERWVSAAGRVTFADGRPVRLVGSVQDVTDRKLAERMLREKEEDARASAAELEAILNCTADGILVYDGEGRTVRSNPAAEEILKVPLEDRAAPVLERVGAQYEVLDEDGRRLAPHELVAPRAALYGQATVRATQRIRAIGHAPRWVMISGVPLVVSGRHAGAVVSLTDITDRKRDEEALRALNARLLEADRRKDEFLGMLSHELRNPLAPIRNSIYVLRHAPAGSAQAARAQTIIERQTEHLSRIVDDLLDVTRIARGKIDLRRSPVDLREVVSRAADDFRLLFRDRAVSFEVAVPDGALWAEADATRLTQVIGNLLHNSAKFTRGGDRVTLSVERAGDAAVIRVADTGAGIDPALLPNVFHPFVQGERTLARTEGGLGLGLALVKGITELHGGTVRAESAGKGKGAELAVSIPLLPSIGPGQAAPAAAGATGGRRVLVVDDNADAAESLADLVALLGHVVDVAPDGPTALEKASAHPPDVVLCDLGLPGMSGYDVARELRARGAAGMQLVAVSGYSQPEDVERALDAGFDAHLAKPADPEALERLIRR